MMDCRYCQKRDAHPICNRCKQEQEAPFKGYGPYASTDARRYEETGR